MNIKNEAALLLAVLSIIAGVHTAHATPSADTHYTPVVVTGNDPVPGNGHDKGVFDLIGEPADPYENPIVDSSSGGAPYFPYNIVNDNNNALYVIGDDGHSVASYNAKTGELLYEVSVNGQYVRSIEWSDSHGRLYIGTDDNQVHYIIPDQPEQLQYFTTLGAPALSIVDTGERIVIVDGTGAWESHHVYTEDGVLIDSREWNHYSRVYGWNPVLNRLYYFRDGTSPNDIEYEDFDPNTGLILAQNDSPYHGDFLMKPPILVSPAGDRVMLGTGDQFDAATLNWLGSIGTEFATGVWETQEEFIVLRDIGGDTQLERRTIDAIVVETRVFQGQPQKIVPTEDGYSVITAVGSELTAYDYMPNDDSDGDGVTNLLDSFPTDPAASVDTDGDGYPDEWNPGMGPDDSTTGLELDAYPNDSACYLPEHGDGTQCDYGATIPDYTPDMVEVDSNGVVYLLSQDNSRVYRWDSVTATHLNPVAVGITQGITTISPISMTVHESHERLYLGYDNGQVSYVELDDLGNEQSFSFTGRPVRALIAADDYLISSEGYYSGDVFLYTSDGVVADQLDYNYASRHNAWNPVLKRLYHFRDGISPADIIYQEVDVVNGQFLGSSDSPYHGSYSISPPIRVSADGASVLLGSGDIYSASTLELERSISPAFVDGTWSDEGETVVIYAEGGNSVVSRRTAGGGLTEQLVFDHSPAALLPVDGGYVIVTLNGQPEFSFYYPSDDSDGDGVPNDQDAFPIDPAASVDTDGDGYPDRWNPRQNEDSSTTGLVLDAFPNDSACYLPEHGLDGSESRCDITATMAPYLPENTVMDKAGIVYLLNAERSLIYRWYQKLGIHLNPIPVGRQQLFEPATPNVMAYSAEHDRLYLGYPDGSVTYIYLKMPTVEHAFATVPGNVRGVASVGNFVLVQDPSGAWDTHYIFDQDGNLKDSKEWNEYSRVYAWNDELDRVYFFRDGSSPNDLHYEDIDQVTGLIVGSGETPYHGDYAIIPPIRVSHDGTQVLLGSGDVYDAQDLTIIGRINDGFKDALYTASGGTITLTEELGQTRLVRRSAEGVVLETRLFDGAPDTLHVFEDVYTVVTSDLIPQFYNYTINEDIDGDGIENADDAFPDDPAASVDSDGDGYPDAWNPGQSGADSTTGLTLDAYPNDTACYLPEHGDGFSCDYSSTIPDYLPDATLMDSQGMVYLLSADNYRVYRWNGETGEHADALAVGTNVSIDQSAPMNMVYSPDHERLYFGYADGHVTYIDVLSPNGEQPFTQVVSGVGQLAAVGNYVFVQDLSGYWATHYLYDVDGNLTDTRTYSDTSPLYVWNSVTERVYYFDGLYTTSGMVYRGIDQSSGQFTDMGSSPYNQNLEVKAPIRFSQDGSLGLLGSGSFFDAYTLQKIGALPGDFVDGQWTEDDGTVVLRNFQGTSELERRTANGAVVETVQSDNLPLALMPLADQYVMVTHSQKPVFGYYVPNDDTDGDGVDNINDAFPLDPAASVDSDGDGYPDAWNDGYTAEDSTTGLELDAYPNDSACFLPAHGDGVNCDYGATLPDFVPDQILADESGYVYMLSIENSRVFTWDSLEQQYVNPIIVGSDNLLMPRAPQRMAYSPVHNRLYFGYDDGEITYVDLENPATEHFFASIPLSVNGLAFAGNYMLAQDASGAWNTHYIFDINGTLMDSEEWNRYSIAYDWNEQLSRIYFFRNGTSPNDLQYETIDQATGQILEEGDSPYHGDYSILPPIRVSDDGTDVLLGSGDVYNALTLEWRYSLPTVIEDAQWLPDGSIVVVRQAGDGNSLLQRRAPGGQVLESETIAGSVTALLTGINELIVVTQGAQPEFTSYVSSDDSDGDGVNNLDDDFPMDPAASVDTDGDGYPDAWNEGYTAEDSTTGLQLDAYPVDSACYLPEHGDGVNCDYGATLPEFEPDQILADESGFIYMLSLENFRVYVWDTQEESYVNPIIIGEENALPSRAPLRMAYSAAHNRLYFGYADGAITYVALDDPAEEQYFASMSFAVNGLASAGQYMLAQDSSGAWYSHYIFDINGALTDSAEWNRYSVAYDWNEQLSRIYFFRNGTSPNDLHFETIDQMTGLIVESGETPYHGDFLMIPPIRVSDNGDRVMLGSGDVYDALSMEWVFAFPDSFVDGQWLPDGGAVMVHQIDQSVAELRRRTSTGVLLESVTYAGVVSSVLDVSGNLIVVTQAERPAFSVYVPSNDSDGDGVDNVNDDFPADPAASVDIDGDGYPDAWNAGYSEADSTTGLTLDAYPLDSACQLPSHGDGTTCDIDANIPAFVADEVITGSDNVIYLLNADSNRVYRWDAASGSYLNPLLAGRLPGGEQRDLRTMAYSSISQRLYLGYADGAVSYYGSDEMLGETQFYQGSDVSAVVPIGDLVLIVDRVDYYSEHKVLDAEGQFLANHGNYSGSADYYWQSSLNRLYFMNDDYSPGRLIYTEIDPVTGVAISELFGPYYGSSFMAAPIRLSPDEDKIGLGSGAMLTPVTLGITLEGISAFADFQWVTNDEVVGLQSSGFNTQLVRQGTNGVTLDTQFLVGAPVAMIRTSTGFVAVTQTDRPQFLLLEESTEQQLLIDPVTFGATPIDRPSRTSVRSNERIHIR